MPDPAPDLDLVAAMEAMQRAGVEIALAARRMSAAGVRRDRMLSIFAGQVAIAAFEVSETVGSEEVTREIAGQLAAMLSSPLAGMAPVGRA